MCDEFVEQNPEMAAQPKILDYKNQINLNMQVQVAASSIISAIHTAVEGCFGL